MTTTRPRKGHYLEHTTMKTTDLQRMIAAAADITRAAQHHEVTLKAALSAAERDEEWADWQIGEAFSPLSQSLADWRGLMGRIFPTQPENPDEIQELAAIVDSWK